MVSPLPKLTVLIIVSSFLLTGITPFSLAQDSTKVKISGYILDSSGNGLADAMIIFNVPEIVPAVYSDFSGYYEIFAPAGTYQVNVWPPFDTNYLSFAQRGFTVGTSNIKKNMTLTTGYKLSGYITDQFGAPVRGALVSLDQFHCGWYSKSSGYYFVTAPVGIYNLLIQPKKGPTFPKYKEENFVVQGDAARDFAVNVQTEQVIPPADDSSAPTPIQPSEPISGDISDDFSTDSGFWQYLGSAYRDQTNQYLVLTTSANDQTGVAFFRTPIQDAFTASFNYKGSGDGFLFFFYKQEYPSPIGWEESYGDNGVAGGRLGFNTGSIIPGYGVEFDGWRNVASEFDDIVGGIPNPSADPSDSHIALIKDFTGNHLAYVNDQRIYDNVWHQVSVEVQGSSVAVYFDQVLVLQWNGVLDRTYGGFGFSGSNGRVEASWHVIDNFSVTASNLQKPSLSVSCRSSTSFSGFSALIDGYLTVDGKGVSGAPVSLSISVNDGKTWEDLTLTYTDAEGHYSATWLPSVTGNYLIKANYKGDANTLGATSEILNFVVTDLTEKNTLFSVSSNSTVTSLAFNSTTSELGFTVTGASGTKGYVKCTIAKSLVSNAENIKVSLDGNQLSYDVTATEDSWLLYFTYTHSSHHVNIKIPTNAVENLLSNQAYWIFIVAAIAIALIGISLIGYSKKTKRKTKN